MIVAIEREREEKRERKVVKNKADTAKSNSED